MKSPFSTVMLAASALFSVSAIFSVAAWADEPVSSLPEGIDFYGKINVSAQLDNDYDSVDSPAVSHKDTNFAWHSYGSRLGAKGKYTLDDDWALVYKVEYEIDANNGYGSQKDFFLAREIYAGIHSCSARSRLRMLMTRPVSWRRLELPVATADPRIF